jgi:hypothetical protein
MMLLGNRMFHGYPVVLYKKEKEPNQAGHSNT